MVTEAVTSLTACVPGRPPVGAAPRGAEWLAALEAKAVAQKSRDVRNAP
jgi:hypothetical protein